jgi:hypothetical protein
MPSARYVFPLLMVYALVAGASCSSPQQCQSSQDCFVNEVCVRGECLSSDAPPDGTTEPGGSDASGVGGDSGVGANSDAGTSMPDTGSGDTGSGDTGVDIPALCVGTGFEICEPRVEEQPSTVANRRIDANYSLAPSTGCVYRDTEFIGYEEEGILHEGRICPTEPADWYTFTLTSCTNRSFIAEVRIVMLACPTEMLDVEFARFNGLPMSCGDANLLCDTDVDGHRVYRFRVDATPSRRDTANMSVGVKSRVALGTFDYDLYYRVYGL